MTDRWTTSATDVVLADVAVFALSDEFHGLPDDETRVADLRRRLDEEGVVELRDFLSEAGHVRLKQQIDDLMSRAQAANNKFAIKGDDLNETLVGELARSRYMTELANRLLGPVAGRPAYIADPITPEEIVPGINIMRTTSDVTHFHFDGTYLNVILAVSIPKIQGDRRGQLVIYPNIRGFKRSLWGTYLAPFSTRVALVRLLLGRRRREVDYVERGAYLFYGYRSLHGVEAQSVDGFRAITNMTVGGARFS